MWQDPIVAETRALREQYASRFGHDGRAIFEDILRRQAASGRQLVTFPPRKPIQTSASSPRRIENPLHYPACDDAQPITPP